MKKLHRLCPICGCPTGENLKTVTFCQLDGEALPNTFDVCSCDRCGFCFDDLDADQTDFNAYYSQTAKYAAAEVGGSGGTSAVDIAKWDRIIRRIRTHAGPDARILDVGCGKGGLLLALKAAGFEDVVGIEPSPACRAGLAANSIPCYANLVDCFVGEVPAFDCVVCSQVLEHVFALRPFVRQLSYLLAPAGVIYVEVPNMQGYAEHMHAPFYYFDREHINHFTPTSLENLFVRAAACHPVYCETGTITSVPGKETPNLTAVYRKGVSGLDTVYDSLGVRAMKNYVWDCDRADVYPQIEDAIGAPVLLWGAGAHLRRLIANRVFADLSIVAVVDRDKGGRGLCVDGIPIISPTQAIAGPQHSTAVFITSVLYAKQIRDTLTEANYRGRVFEMAGSPPLTRRI